MAFLSGWLRCAIGVVVSLMFVAPSVWAQQNSGITGVVLDESKSVLPGVTVEVSSPALIEKVRTVITDGEGRYTVTALVPGTYTVVFTLPGFSTLRREGIVLTSGFVATVNGDLSVGGVEETVTVTGASPVVDTTSVRGQTLVSQELLAALPTSSLSLAAVQRVTPGLGQTSSNRADIGGSQGTFWGNSMGVTYHGKINARILVDGLPGNDFVSAMPANFPNRLEASGYFVNLGAVAETAFESSAVAAESLSSGISFNSIPKSGGNRFSFRGYGVYGADWLIADNVGDSGLFVQGKTTRLFTGYGALGGPIVQDRLWFFTAPKGDYLYDEAQGPWNFNTNVGSPFYVPDPNRPAELWDKVLSVPVRLTWQASGKDTVNGSVDVQPYCGCPQFAPPGFAWAAEAQYWRLSRGTMTQVSWTRPQTNRVLLEAAASYFRFRVDVPNRGNTPNDIGIIDTSRALTYNARLLLGLTIYGDKGTDRYAQRASLSYVTGSHNLKVGFQMDEGTRFEENKINQDIHYNFQGSEPGNARTLSLRQYATPYTNRGVQNADLIIYAQDRWTMNRLTVNAGLQFGYTNAYAPAQEVAATRFVPYVRSFPRVSNLPNYKDFNPRLGAAYDLFGTGRTALKASVSRYTFPVGVGMAMSQNPILASVNVVDRDWIDAAGAVNPNTGVIGNGNYVPDCDLLNPAANGECGRWLNQNFGGSVATTQWDPRTTQGWHNRDGYWEVTAEVQQQLVDRASMTFGYYHNWQFGQRVTRNTAVDPATDFSPYSIVAPVDSRLPGGGGYTVTGLYDLNPAKLGQVTNVVMPASDFGDVVNKNDFINLTVQGRFGESLQVGGGFDTGRSVSNYCFVVNSPQDLFTHALNDFGTDLEPCRVVRGMADQMQVRGFASYRLPGDVTVSAIYSNTPGEEIRATYLFTRAQVVGLGRQLSTTSARTHLLLDEAQQYDERKSLLDLQLGKQFDFGNGWRVRPQLAIYNVFNSDVVVGRGNTFGPLFGPSVIVPGRTVQFVAEVTF